MHRNLPIKEDELSFEEGDLLFVVDQKNPEWWLARCGNEQGLIPSNYVSQDPSRVPLIEASRRGNEDMIIECLAGGVSVNSLAKSGNSALHAAAQGGHIGCVQILLQQTGILLDLQNKLGDTPLHCAAYRGHALIVSLLLQHKARHDIVNRDGVTARGLATSGEVIALLEEMQYSKDRRSSNFDDGDFGVDDNDEDSD
ncbi:osteoclast-stimulating factor 1-like isoform X2 [Oratosquilla oratoria]|uniref:osteoclast-stimulating factor 1-like isoform X2 n=1 Tax=Oratosquilla oratoria TaxID=337810 RepID=UPI003F763971